MFTDGKYKIVFALAFKSSLICQLCFVRMETTNG